jgi:hypothetical protein
MLNLKATLHEQLTQLYGKILYLSEKVEVLVEGDDLAQLTSKEFGVRPIIQPSTSRMRTHNFVYFHRFPYAIASPLQFSPLIRIITAPGLAMLSLWV